MLDSKKIRKNIILASCLESIPEKNGCTSRTKNYKENSKLEYFIISGINIGDDFFELAERIKKENYNQPSVIYDIALSAQKNSKRNRNGGKINYGIIELLVPIVTAQLVYNNYDIDELFLNVTDVLKNTSKDDVKYHHEFRKLARELSGKVPDTEFYDVNSIYDYYSLKLNCLDDYVHEQYLNNLSIIKKGYNLLNNYYNDNLLSASVMVFEDIINDCHNFSPMAADYICIILYLFLCYKPDSIII